MSIKINTSNPYSAIKTINHTLGEISKTFGADSRQLQQMQAQLDLVLGEGATRINSKGQLTLRNTAETRANISDAESAEALGNLPTASEYMEQAKARTRADRGDEKVSKREAVEHEQKVDAVKNASERIRQILSAQKNAGEDIHAMGYDELYDLIADDFDDSYDEGDYYEPDVDDWIDVDDDFWDGGLGSVDRL